MDLTPQQLADAAAEELHKRALTVQRDLARPFPTVKLRWRPGATNKDKTKAIGLAYIDARDVMNRLDEACGFGNWQDKYELADGKLLICSIGIRVNGEWLWRANGAGDTQVEAEKGKISDAFKRAAVNWGIGRYLYALPNNWYPIVQRGKSFVFDKVRFDVPEWATPEGYDTLMAKRDAQDASDFVPEDVPVTVPDEPQQEGPKTQATTPAGRLKSLLFTSKEGCRIPQEDTDTADDVICWLTGGGYRSLKEALSTHDDADAVFKVALTKYRETGNCDHWLSNAGVRKQEDTLDSNLAATVKG